MRQFEDIKGAILKVVCEGIYPHEEIDDLVNACWVNDNVRNCPIKHIFVAIEWAISAHRLKEKGFRSPDKRYAHYYARKRLDSCALPLQYHNFEVVEAGIIYEESMAFLPKRQAFALKMRLEGYRFKEIAAMTGTTKQNIHELYSTAIKSLQAKYRGNAKPKQGRGLLTR
jgi:hypothetical protein